MLSQINKKKCERHPLFITLTYPDVFPESAAEWKEHLRRFSIKLERGLKARYAAIWRLELKVRKSGEVNAGMVAPHYHLLLFCDRKPAELYFLVSKWWAEVVGSPDERHIKAGTNIRKVNSWRGVMSYAAKYMGKVEALRLGPDGAPYAGPHTKPGRFWGVWNADLLPIELLDIPVTVDAGIRVRRTFRRHAGLRPSGVYDSLTCYMHGSTILSLVELYAGVPDG